MTLLDFARLKRALLRRNRRKHTYSGKFRSGLGVRVVDRETGKELRRHYKKNTVTGVATLVDLINGTSSDHLASGADLRIQDSGGGLIKTIGSQRSGYPTAASGALITLGWEDLTTDAYNPDDIYMRTPGGTTIAETLNVAWSNKVATENWFFDWDLSLSGTGFDNAGLNGMLDAITGGTHFDGTEGAATMRIQVYDGSPGSLEVTQVINNASTQPTSTQLRFTFTVGSGTAYTWARVELQWNPSTLVYDDDIANQNQGVSDSFEYEITISFS